MIVLAYDPGESTGWCWVDTASSKISGGSFELWSEVDEHMAMLPTLRNKLILPDIIVVERFLLYPQAAKRLSWNKLRTIEVIGVIRYLAEGIKIPVVMQNARNGKRIELAKKPLHFDKHACDALRHALMYLKREELLTEELKEYINVWP